MKGFLDAAELVLSDRIEGGYVNNQKDSGGETNHGITQPILDQAKRLALVPTDTTIKSLMEQQAQRIYQKLFWETLRCGEVPYCVGLLVFDTAINHGQTWAAKSLQSTLRVRVDGIIGPETVSAVHALNYAGRIKLLINLCRVRLKHYLREVPPVTEEEFELGWAYRVVDVLAAAVEAAVEERIA